MDYKSNKEEVWHLFEVHFDVKLEAYLEGKISARAMRNLMSK